jgi:EpsI family protein
MGDSVDRSKTTWIAAAIVAAAGVSANMIRATEAGDRGPLRLDSAAIAADSSFVDESLDSDFQETLRAREVLYRMYAPESDAPVWVFLAYFDQQREGSQVHSPRHCYPGAGWSIENEIAMKADWRDGEVHGLVVSDGVVRRLVCYWYQMPGDVTPDVLQLKLALTRRAVLRKPQDVVYGNVSTRIDDDMDTAYARIAPYVRDAEFQVDRLYREQNERQSDSE